uniref:Uncharacterized protein n=1 Tax=Ralstonia solanacearum TaxID=305 RepID=A0A0S4TQ30_RALSL|nr:protein of unknown function [Ralstonia solanacearum]
MQPTQPTIALNHSGGLRGLMAEAVAPSAGGLQARTGSRETYALPRIRGGRLTLEFLQGFEWRQTTHPASRSR